jgi:hypothetical protein
MHTRHINERNRVARATIRATAERLAERLGVPPLVAINAIEGRDPAVAPMRELECIAVLLQDVERALEPQTVGAARLAEIPGGILTEEVHHGSEQTEDRPRQRGRRPRG